MRLYSIIVSSFVSMRSNLRSSSAMRRSHSLRVVEVELAHAAAIPNIIVVIVVRMNQIIRLFPALPLSRVAARSMGWAGVVGSGITCFLLYVFVEGIEVWGRQSTLGLFGLLRTSRTPQYFHLAQIA